MPVGRKPLPTALKLIAGNPGRRALNDAEPKPETKIPACPAPLSKLAKAEWNRITVCLGKLDMISDLDVATLALYCEAWADVIEARQKIAELGKIITTPNGHEQPSPWVSLARQAGETVRKLAVEFGLTPSSRSRIAVEKKPEVDELAELSARHRRA